MGGAVATALAGGAKEGGASAREEGGGRKASSGPFLVVVVLRRHRPPDLFLSPPPSGARWRKPRRRPPPLPPRPIDARAAHDASAIPPPVDARARPCLPINDGGDGGAALPVAKKSPSSSSSGALDGDAAEAEARRRLTSSRREALGLYRDILRVTWLFEWPDGRDVLWREVLQANARREFEEARGERDPDAVQQALDRLAEASSRMIEAEEAKRRCVSPWRPGGSEAVAHVGCGEYDGVVMEYDVERGVPVWERDEHEGRRV
uniref:Complex 1 LYR protein domain-containing protein n=1 Tax=Oryza meridionalis TaxID=40149 RepID=A0A0E0E546_9ORYZ